METIKNLTVDILAERLVNLRESGKSGLVAYFAFEDSDDVSVVYFHELDTVSINCPIGRCYCNFSCSNAWKQYLEDFIEWGGGTESRVDNPDGYLADAYDSLIWLLAHADDGLDDDWACEDIDFAELDADNESYGIFRLCGGETVGQDILAFREKLVSGGHFTISGKDGSVFEFGLDYDTVFSLVYYADEIYQDDVDGPVPVKVSRRLLRTAGFDTLYAKSKAFILLNFVNAG